MRLFKCTYTEMIFGDSFVYVVAESFDEALTLFTRPKLVSIAIVSHRDDDVIVSKSLERRDGA